MCIGIENLKKCIYLQTTTKHRTNYIKFIIGIYLICPNIGNSYPSKYPLHLGDSG